MNTKPLIGRLLKWLGWAVLGLITLILVVALLVHLPPVQKVIASKISKYLSETVHSEVSISGIHLSAMDGIAIVGLEVYDPAGEDILRSDRITVLPDLAGLFFGKYHIHYLGLEGFRGKLSQSEQGLNIQFIIDAFSSQENDTVPEQDQNVSITIDQVLLENIQFDYISQPDSINISLYMGILEVDQIGVSTLPGEIKTNRILLDHIALTVLSESKSETTEPTSLPPLDFGSGFDIEIGEIEFIDNSVSYHFRAPEKTLKFDPDHLDLDSIKIYLTDIIIREDSLSLDLKQFSTSLGALDNVSLSSEIDVGLNNARISELQLSTGGSRLNLTVNARYKSWAALFQNFIDMDLALQTDGIINLVDISYFLPDSMLLMAADLPRNQFEFAGDLNHKTLNIETLKFVSGESQLTAAGLVNDIQDPDNMGWEQVELGISIGPEFKTLILPYSAGLDLPANIQVQLLSSGMPKLFNLQTQLTSIEGTAEIEGRIGVHHQDLNLQSLKVSGKKLEVGKILGMPWLGRVDFSMEGNGTAGKETNLSIDGRVHQININTHNLGDIEFSGNYSGNTADINIDIEDPRYGLALQSQLELGEVLNARTNLELADFNLGRLLDQDSTLIVSGKIVSEIGIEPSAISAEVNSSGILLRNDSLNYPIDSLALNSRLASDGSTINFQSDNLIGSLEANFDVREAPDLIAGLFENAGQPGKHNGLADQSRNLKFDLQLTNDKPLKFLNNSIEHTSDLKLAGRFDERAEVLEVSVNTGSFSGFGLSLDSVGAHFQLQQNMVDAELLVNNIYYDSLNLGNLDFHVLSEDSVNAVCSVSLKRDSLILFETLARVKPAPSELLIYLDSLIVVNRELTIDRENPITLSPYNVLFDRYRISNEEMNTDIDGDLHEFELSINDMDLTGLNALLFNDSILIYHGNLNALFAFVKADQKINLQTRVDSLTFKNTPAVDLSARAITENGHVPITFSLNSSANNINFNGDYNQLNSAISGRMTMEINELEMFQFLMRDVLESANGKVDGQIDISGTLNSPQYLGEIRFNNVEITPVSPRSTFHLDDELLTLNNTGVVLRDFVIKDQQQNPLTLNGSLLTTDYQNFEYDFTVQADNYMLINNPPEEEYQLQGTLVIGSDIALRGNKKDFEVEAELVIRDTTALTYVMPQQDLELLTDEGIVEFINPRDSLDITESQVQTMYDSLISTLPGFNLNTSIQLEENALLRIVLDQNSGDFIEATGSANLKYTLDRTKNAELIGDYTINSGFYQLSFYDLVKKRFELTEGSTVKWSGSPNKGELDIKATYMIKTSSIGLIGHEIGENEKELYRRALPYEVGIIIGGDLENPEVSFSLDLPQDEKINYPALSNKLSRLQQSEFESELNKQVFGLLVLGGFIPEESTDFDEHLIATTALSNSVNSILASQLNRFANHLIKGVDIDVGLQSYSDYGSGGGQTRTSMDFRISKRLMDDRLSIEVGGGMDINSDKSGSYAGSDNFRGDIAVIYDLTESGNKQLKLFNNETYDIIYHEIRNTGVSLIFIREFDKKEEQPKP